MTNKLTKSQLNYLAAMDGRPGVDNSISANAITRGIVERAGFIFAWDGKPRTCWVTPEGKTYLDAHWTPRA